MTNTEEFVWHNAKEEPEFYPERLIPAEIGDKKGVLLANCHSKHYVPTEEARKILRAKLNKFSCWAYLQEKIREK